MAPKQEPNRIYANLFNIVKICAALAVFAVVLAIYVRAPGKNGGEGAVPVPGAAVTELSEKLLNGRYKQVYYNGDVYIGDFIDSVRSGQGTYTWANGVAYTGEFSGGEPNGNGSYIYPDGTTKPPPPTNAPTEAPSEAASPPTTESPPPETDPPPTETAALPPSTDPPTSAYFPETPKSGFMQLMFEQAVDVPGSGKKIEPPPLGRSLEMQYGAVPLSEAVPEPYGYFRDIIFLGDSVTLGFDMYKGKIKFGGETVLRDANVISVGSYGINNALREITADSIHPFWGGKQTRPEDIIAQKDAKYVFICLGLNDLGYTEIEDFAHLYLLLIDRIKEKSPGKTVVIMSVTPLVRASQKTKLNNDAIARANNALLVLARERSIPFIDYGAAIRDSQNNLYDELSSDAYCHLTVTAYDRIVEYLLHHPLP